jgi:hypothetical protein
VIVLVLCAAGVAALGIAGLALRTETVRGVAIASTLAVLAVFGHNSAPSSMWVPAFLFCIALVVVAEFRSSARRAVAVPVVAAVIAWWGIVAVGAWLGDSYSLSRLAAYAGLAVVLALSVARTTSAERRMLLHTLIAIGVAETAVGAAEWAVGEPLVWDYRSGIVRMNPFFGDTVARVQGTTGHPIVFGYLLGLVCVLVWANPTGLRSSVRLPLLAVVATGLVLSGTRSAVLTASIAIVLHILSRFRLLTWLRGAALLSAVAVVLALVDVGLRDLVERTVDSGSWVQRVGSLRAIPALLDRPPGEAWWGTGFGSETRLYDAGYLSSPYGLEVVDNFVVYVLGTMGIVGALATTALVVVAVVHADRATRSLIAFSVGMFFSFDVVVWFFTGILLVVVIALPNESRSPVPRRRPAGVDAAHRDERPREGHDATPPAPKVQAQEPRDAARSGSADHDLPWRQDGRPHETQSPAPARTPERQKTTRERIAEARPDGPLVRHLPPLD